MFFKINFYTTGYPQISNLQTVNTNYAVVLAQNAVALAQTQTKLNQTTTLLAQTQAVNIVLMNRLNAVTSCGSVGLFADAQGACIPTNRSTSGGVSSSSSCSSGSATVAQCAPGFSPSKSSTPACADPNSQAFPTTFQCEGLSNFLYRLFV